MRVRWRHRSAKADRRMGRPTGHNGGNVGACAYARSYKRSHRSAQRERAASCSSQLCSASAREEVLSVRHRQPGTRGGGVVGGGEGTDGAVEVEPVGGGSPALLFFVAGKKTLFSSSTMSGRPRSSVCLASARAAKSLPRAPHTATAARIPPDGRAVAHARFPHTRLLTAASARMLLSRSILCQSHAAPACAPDCSPPN